MINSQVNLKLKMRLKDLVVVNSQIDYSNRLEVQQ